MLGLANLLSSLAITVEEVLPYILGAGGVAFLTAVFKFVQDMRSSAEGREAVAIKNLERWRDDADARADRCLERLDRQRGCTAYWQSYAGMLAHQLASHGHDIPLPPGPPPKVD